MTGLTRVQGILYGYIILTIGFIFLYFNQDPVRHWVDSWSEYLEGALIFPKSVVFPFVSLLDFAGTVFVCRRYRQSSCGEKSWFEIFLACILMQFGGTTIVGVLLGQVPSWIMSRSAIPGFVLAWWLTFYSPDDFFWRHVSGNRILMFFLGILAAVSSAFAVTSWGLDKAFFNSFHVNGGDFSKSCFLCILCGAFAASGGGILADVFNFFSQSKSFTMRHKSSFFDMNSYTVSAAFNRSFWLAVLYFVMISDPKDFLPISFHLDKITGHSVITILQVSFYFMSCHVPSMDIYQEFSNFILDCFNIPSTYAFSTSVASANVAAEGSKKNI
jgi:hypothetical protein